MIETAYLLQSVLIILWWAGIFLSQDFFRVFQFPGINEDMFLSFFIPDVAVIAVLSLIRAYRKSINLQFIILGAFLYATLFCVNAAFQSGGGLFPTFIMILGLTYNYFLCYRENLFKSSSSSNTITIALRTIIQIISIWFLALGLIPLLLLRTFASGFYPQSQAAIWTGVVLFLLCSSLGLYSAFVMVRDGRGTPLPLDQTNRLVTKGPYAIIRNPMAVAGIGQGFAISLIFLSLPILIYCLLGALIWHFVVRPIEEEDMLARFGKEYEAYRSRVRCWVPTLSRNTEP